MDNKKELKIIYFRESLVQSVIADTYLFGVTAGTFWFNYKFLGGNRLLYMFLLVTVFSSAYARVGSTSKRFSSYKKMLAYLKSQEKL